MENPLISYLKSHHDNYLKILAQNDNYVLAVPPADLLPETLDEKIILHHILQLSFTGKDLNSLEGTQFKLRQQGRLLRNQDHTL